MGGERGLKKEAKKTGKSGESQQLNQGGKANIHLENE